jgi:polyisoprenyl-phosphate glycosyltransferase
MYSEKKPLVTVICPVFNEQETIPIFYERFKAVADALADRYDFQLLFTNNRSKDRTLELIRELHAQDPRVEVLTLSRNFGYQGSVVSGMTYASGDLVCVIDVDCEDPPEMLPQFLREYENGHDIVYGIRHKRHESAIIQWVRRMFYRTLRFMADSDIILDMAEFALITSEVRQHVIANTSTFPFVRTEIAYVGFERTGIPYTREPRVQGKTHYNLVTMTIFAVGGILSSGTALLRAAAFVGAGLLPINAALLIASLIGQNLSSFEILVSLDLMYLVFFIAVLSIYIARIYKNGVNRPIFIVDWKKSIYHGARKQVKMESVAKMPS